VQELLRSMLVKHRGLELISLQTLQPTPLVPPAKAADQVAGQAGQPSAGQVPKADSKMPPAKSESIHKQGLEIKIAGNYLDLLSYVSDLERLPQKLLWGSLSLTVTAYPRSELTLTVYSLSPDSRWLVL
jgi:MSHA biogenesis protein MshJ